MQSIIINIITPRQFPLYRSFIADLFSSFYIPIMGQKVPNPPIVMSIQRLPPPGPCPRPPNPWNPETQSGRSSRAADQLPRARHPSRSGLAGARKWLGLIEGRWEGGAGLWLGRGHKRNAMDQAWGDCQSPNEA
jgi:hypothetical protein